MDLDTLIAEVEERSSSHEPLDRVAAAAHRHEELAAQADQLLDHFVQAAREASCSWAQIGEVLGVTKQAAQQRHGRWPGFNPTELLKSWRPGRPGRGGRGGRAGLFHRFTPRARASVVNAQEAARTLGHDHVGTGHVLLGILRNPEGVGAKALARWSLTPTDVEKEIEQRLGRGEPGGTEHVRFDADAKKSLELALREALQLGHNHIGTEHMLLGIVRADGGLAAAILRDREIRPDEVRAAVLEEIEALEAEQGRDDPADRSTPDEDGKPDQPDEG